MSHTVRAYNLPGYLFWHPYRQHPNWHLRKDLNFTKTRRAARKAETRNLSKSAYWLEWVYDGVEGEDILQIYYD